MNVQWQQFSNYIILASNVSASDNDKHYDKGRPRIFSKSSGNCHNPSPSLNSKVQSQKDIIRISGVFTKI